jgi:phospholipase A-2-activating protein
MSGSVDFTNKMYNYNKATGVYDFDKEVKYHDGFVMKLMPEITGNGFFSAGRDNKIFHIDINGTPLMQYEGHTMAVNSLCQADPTEFMSGSWDGTAKVWDINSGEVKKTLEGHTHGTEVLTLPNGITVTGSQDGNIHVYHQLVHKKKVKGHTDAIRKIVEIPSLGFATVSNDEFVKVWDYELNALQTLSGHGGYVFCACLLESGDLATGGDDCTVRIWSPASGELK